MLVGLLAGCSRKPAAPITTVAPAAPAASSPQAAGKDGAHGSRKAKDLDVPVFVDGQQVATLRHGELPPGFAPVPASSSAAAGAGTAKAARFYRLGEYLSKVGAPTAKVAAVHLRGNNNRIASIEGDELRSEPNRFLFDFMEGDSGIAKTRWDTTGLRNTFRIDEIRAVFVFAEKSAPTLAPRRSCYVGEPTQPSGEVELCSDKIPYADAEPAKGTRIYLDGRLVGQVKRRKLQDELIVGTEADGKSRFAMAKLLRSFGVEPSRARGVELVSGDDVVGRGSDLAKREDALTFVLPAHRHGRVLLDIPAGWQATTNARSGTAAEVTAVLIYQSTVPSKRPLTPIPDVPPPEDMVTANPIEDG